MYCAVEVVNYAHFPLVELFISELRESLTARNSHDGAGFAAKSCQTTKCAICMCDFFPRKKRGGGKTCCFVSSATVGKSGKKECCSVIKHNVMYCFEVAYWNFPLIYPESTLRCLLVWEISRSYVLHMLLLYNIRRQKVIFKIENQPFLKPP